MTAGTRIWEQQGATWTLRVVLLLALATEGSHGTYNCSRSLPPWIYINESILNSGGQILYDGEPNTSLDQWTFVRYPMYLSAYFEIPDIPRTSNGGIWVGPNFNLDNYLPMQPPIETLTVDYNVTCAGGKSNSISIVFVDENDENPGFLISNASIELSEDTCIGQDIYNFAGIVLDKDFADKPNEQKLQLVILQSTPLSDIFSISGRLGIRLNKLLNKSRSPYVLMLTLQDQAFHNASSTFEFTISVTAGLTLNSSDSNLKNCRTLNTSLPGVFWPYYCSAGDIFVTLFESEVKKGRPIKYGGAPIQHLTKLVRKNCYMSFSFLGLTNDGVLVINSDFDLDDELRKPFIELINCQYAFSCNASDNKSTVLTISVLNENDEAPIFTSDSPMKLSVYQETEFVLSFRGHVHDRDYADWPNDDRLELIIVRDLWDSCGKVVSGIASVTERLALKIQPMLNILGCSPYHLTVALKDQASNIGPHRNLTIYASADGHAYCETQTINVGATRFVTLPWMRAPSVVELPCVSTGEPLLVARCERLGHDLPIAEYNITLSKAICFDNISRTELLDVYMVPVTTNNILNVTIKIENLTSSSYELHPEDLSYVSRILKNLTRFNDSSEDKAITNATELLSKVLPHWGGILSNLMEAADVLEKTRRMDSEFTDRVVNSFDTMLLKLADAISGSHFNITAEDLPVVQRKNLAYQIATDTVIAGLVTCSLANGTTIAVALPYNSSASSECLKLNGLPRAELKLSRAVRDVPRTFVVYTSAAFFGFDAPSEAAVLSGQLTKTPKYEASGGEEHLASLRLRLDEATIIKNGSLACGYWNFSSSRWDTDGCSSEPTVDVEGMFVCTCNHLTNFAVLMVPCVGDCGETVHDDVLGYLSLAFLAVSCVALVLVLVSFFACRVSRQSDAQRLTACLSASLLCMNLLFIFGIKAAKDDASACSALAVVLHYFLLTSFLFMTAEVILSYMRLVKVFNSHVSHFIWKVLAVCLGVPMGVVIGVRFGNPSLYVRSDRYCWVQPTLQIYGVMIPVGVAISFNLIMFVLIAKSLTRRPQLRSSIGEQKQTIRQAKALVAVFAVLGITWAFGLLATIKASSVVFQYLFVISNALQGLFVFIFHAVKAPVITCCRKSVTGVKAVGSTPKDNNYSDGAGGDMSLSTKTQTLVSGSRESIGAASDSLSITTNSSDISGLRFS